MPHTRSRHVLERAPEEPEPAMAQLLAFLIRQSEDQRLERDRDRAERRAELEEKRAEREERRAEKLARREEEARRANAPRAGNIESFFKLRPPSFLGSEGALAAEDWVKEVGKFLVAAKIAEEDKVPFATLLLKGNAQIWWEAEIPKYQALGVDPTWSQFSTCFLKKYFPATQEALMKAKFANLVQGSMTVDEYTAEFTRLSRFCPVIAASASEMMEKFRLGLRQEIQDEFAILDLTTFDAVLETARKVELVHQRKKASAQQALVRRPIPQQQFQPLDQIPPPLQLQQRNGRSGGVICHYCRMTGHKQKGCWRKNRLCLACGAPDHLKAACPRLHSSES